MIIRKADIQDSSDILSWRNDPVTRSMFITNIHIGIDDHIKWYNSILQAEHIAIFIGVFQDFKVGVCRFDYCNIKKATEVSINLNPRMRGKKLSHELLVGSIYQYRISNKYPLIATIKKINLPSLLIFIKSGFSIEKDDCDYIYLIRAF